MGSLGLLGAIWPRAGSSPCRAIPASPMAGMVPTGWLSPFPGQVPRAALGCPRAQSRVFPVGRIRPGPGQAQPSPELCGCPPARGLPRSRSWKPPAWAMLGHGQAPPILASPGGFLPCAAPYKLLSLSQGLRQGCVTPRAQAELEQNDSPFPLPWQETPRAAPSQEPHGASTPGLLPATPGMPPGPGLGEDTVGTCFPSWH